MYIFASDPHGTGQPWIDLVEQAKQAYPKAQVVFGGDYIDGRSFNKETLDYVMTSVKAGAIALLGNHEQMMLDFIDQQDDFFAAVWYGNGAKTTIKSLLDLNHCCSKRMAKRLLQETDYYQFIKGLPLDYQTDNITFVHAGIKPDGSPTDRDYKLWAREEYWYGWENQSADKLFTVFAHNQTGKTIVTGHTPTCLINGFFNDPHVGYPDDEILSDTKDYQCPVVSVQFIDEPARIFTDNGCHGDLQGHNGNIVVLNDDGTIAETFS